MLVTGDDDYSAGHKTFSLKVDNSGRHFTKESVDPYAYSWAGKTSGLLLHIDNNSYTLYKKVNQFTPEPTVALTHTLPYAANKTTFFAQAKTLSEVPIILSAEEESFLNRKIEKAQEEAMQAIQNARLTNNTLGMR